jgi:hypothetical protein
LFFDPVLDETVQRAVLTNADFGNVRGVDLSLIRRFGDWFNGTVTYTYQVAKSTGTDPYSYLGTTARRFSAVTGERIDAPQATLPFGENREHNIGGALSFSFPHDFAPGTWYGRVLSKGGAFMRFRFASGLPYTKLQGTSEAKAPFGGWDVGAYAVEDVNSSRMPWVKELDLRLTRGFRLGGLEWTLYGDFRNVLNFTTIVQLYAGTGDIVHPLQRSNWVGSETSSLEAEAGQFLVTEDDGSHTILLPADCGAWGRGPVNCVALKRAEVRFGNGDGRYAESEYRSAFTAEYEYWNGTYDNLAAPRHIRIGAELRF